MFQKKNLSEKTWSYIDNLKLHVFEMRYLPEKTKKLFQSDMRIVVDFLAEGDGYRSDRKITHEVALIKMIKVLLGENDVDQIENWIEEQGIREGIEMSKAEIARLLVTNVENAMEYFQVTLEKACEALGITLERYEEAKKVCCKYEKNTL